MHIIVCLDEQKGMMFNRRRQSRDKKVREDMLSLIDGKLWVSPYTARQFASEEQERLEVSEQFLSLAQQGEFCFVEEQDVLPYVEKIEDMIVYYWKRHYPADMFFTVNLEEFELQESIPLVGNSHPEMIRERYQKKLVETEIMSEDSNLVE